MIDISVVVPVRNEEGNLRELARRLTATLTTLCENFEVIMVTDENTDNTLEILKELNRLDERFKTIKLSRSCGHQIAVFAGLQAARGNAVVIMDGDLQDYPEDIALLYKKFKEGFDVVYSIKERKNDSTIRNIVSRLFVKVMHMLSDYRLDFNTSMFRIISRRMVNELLKFGEREPALTALMSLIGFPTAKVLVTSGKRLHGQTKYTLGKQLSYALSFLLSFTTKPLRVISITGLCVSVASLLYFIVVIVQTLFFRMPVLGWPTIVTLLCFLGGVQLLALGIIAEYIGRIFMESKGRPLYVIEQRIGKFE